MKVCSFSLSEKDVEKIDFIKDSEQIQSKSEVLRRLIDARFREIQNGQKT